MIAHVNVTNPEVLLLNTTPVTVIPSPGPGRTVVVLGAYARTNNVSIPYVYPSSIFLQYALGPIVIANDLGDMLASPTAQNGAFVGLSGGAQPIGDLDYQDQAIIFDALVGNPTLGDGDIDIWLVYQIVPAL